ncbi:uncharacterized protein V6R79_016297 [Siganus canaliculatus]
MLFDTWILLAPLLLGAKAFMIYNSQPSLCLEDSAGEVLLKKCDLNSDSQQWLWLNEGMLECVASSRCLSATQTEGLRTQPCPEPQEEAAGFLWDCDRDRLISKDTSMLLSVDGQKLVLAHISTHSTWKSVDRGSICQETLRSRRASDADEFETTEQQVGDAGTMTEEERQHLRWFYRTEDPTMWRYVLLGASFICLLIGFLLLGMGAMANKNRKKIQKYKVAAAAASQKGEGEELRLVSVRDSSGGSKTSLPPPFNGELTEVKGADIVVTWKDGNTSSLYPDPAEVEEKQQEEEAAEKQTDEAVKSEE